MKKMIPTGAFLGALSVILGAFGTHGLRGKIGYDLLQIYETGTHYLMIHSFAILIYGLWHQSVVSKGNSPKPWPVMAFLVGTFIFTGSLYAITFSGIRTFGAITPVGGILYIVGWIGFALQASKLQKAA